MRQLKNRALFVLIFAALLAAGLVIFLALYVVNGGSWAAFSANRHVYSDGQLATGTIYDREGVLLYDGESASYSESAELRRANLHVVGDLYGNIASGARTLFASSLVGFSPITGTTGGGHSLYLSVDSQVNATAYAALNGQRGTVAVYNYVTGEILCMVSSPSYDPTSSSDLAALADGDADYDGAYLNRALSATYPPGSVFKVVTAAAAIETLDYERFSYTCTGSMAVGDTSVTCTSAHGTQTLKEALANSCNCAFAALALELGSEALLDYVQQAGLVSSQSVSGCSTAAGRCDLEEDGSAELAWSGVGQANVLVNPCAIMTLMGCIAGDGTAAAPRLLSAEHTASGRSVAVDSSTVSIGWDDETCEILREYLRNNVTVTYGQSRFGDLEVCAKSGTAEVDGGNPHAWFAGFIDSEETPYAFVVVVENGGSGSSVAGSVAAAVLAALTE
ncbi:MAG: penicillin-binding protein [Oscillospiraceae bacterium]|nr:penicillin-binding protein [Oscillospiraceae bacterium]